MNNIMKFPQLAYFPSSKDAYKDHIFAEAFQIIPHNTKFEDFLPSWLVNKYIKRGGASHISPWLLYALNKNSSESKWSQYVTYQLINGKHSVGFNLPEYALLSLLHSTTREPTAEELTKMGVNLTQFKASREFTGGRRRRTTTKKHRATKRKSSLKKRYH